MTEIAITRPRPLAGRVAIAPIPAGTRELQDGDQEKKLMGQMLLGLQIEVGFIAGIVLEISELPDRLTDEREYLTPYPLGSTVYYPAGAAIKLKGWHYVPLNEIVAWEAPEEAR